jgi:hypothetical protein
LARLFERIRWVAIPRLLATIPLTCAVSLASREADAGGPLGAEVGAIVGYGTSPGGAAVNPLGVGFGGRAGITLFGLYAGLDVVDYAGSGDGNGGRYHAIQLGGELGYGFKVFPVTIRPQVGVGDLYLSGSVAGLTSPWLPTANCLYLEPGAVALVSIGVVYVAVDASALIVRNEPAYVLSGIQYNLTTSQTVAFTMHGQSGLKF